MADFSGRQKGKVIRRTILLVILAAAAVGGVVLLVKRSGVIENAASQIQENREQRQEEKELAENPPLTIGEYTEFSGSFNPFFPQTEADEDVIRMTQELLLQNDEYGLIVEDAIDNADYPGIANLNVSQQGDEIWYEISLLETVCFSDGVGLTADDVIFSMYVLCDPSYAGKYDMKALPIKGLEAYLEGEADSVSGIQRVGDYRLRIVMAPEDALQVYGLQIPVVPLHCYGDRAQYDYDRNQFGFPKGDLSLTDAQKEPVGAGPYLFRGFADETVRFESNENYYRKEAVTKYLELVQLGNGRDWNDVDRSYLPGELAYYYVGINADRVNMEGNPDSDASRKLRRIFATAFTYARNEHTDFSPSEYRILDYPNPSNSSLPLNNSGMNDGTKSRFCLNAEGKNLYDTIFKVKDETGNVSYSSEAGMLDALGKMKGKAGVSGESQEYTLYLKTDGEGNSPFRETCLLAASYLEQVQIKLSVQEIADEEMFRQLLINGEADMWCTDIRIPRESLGREADLSPYYLPEGEYNYYHIRDERLAGMIQGQNSIFDTGARLENYRECLDIVLDWAVDIPLTHYGYDSYVAYRWVDRVTQLEK